MIQIWVDEDIWAVQSGFIIGFVPRRSAESCNKKVSHKPHLFLPNAVHVHMLQSGKSRLHAPSEINDEIELLLLLIFSML